MTSLRPKTLTAVVALLISPAIMAAPYSNIVAFGDSLTDSGQFPDSGAAALGIPANARFTNRLGPTFQAPEPFGDVAIQHVSRALGLGELNPSTANWSGVATGVFSGTDYAVAGNVTSQILASIVAENGSVVDVPGADVSTPPHLLDPRTRNGYLVDHPEADSNALYFINGGANDVFGGLITDPASAANSAANLASGINALHDAGANYIMVSNVPELDGTALAYLGSMAGAPGPSNPIHPDILGPLSRLFNEALYQEMRESPANIIPMDVAGLLSEARSNPARFGFANVNTCFNGAGGNCIEDPQFGITGGTPDPTQLLFNDGVHPTAAAQEIIADYMLSILQAPSDISMLPVFGLQLTQTDLKRQQNLLNDTRGLDTFGEWQLSLAVEGSNYTSLNNRYDARFDGDYSALSISGQKRIDQDWRLGSQLTVGESQFLSRSNASYTDIENIGLSLFATYDHARYFANAIIQLDQLRYANIYRHTPLGPDSARGEEGDTKGTTWGFASEVGYDISFDEGNWRYGPRLELYVADSQVDGYSEYSSTVTSLSYGDQSLASQQVDLGVFAQYLSSDKTVSFTGKLGLVNELDMEGDDLEARLQSQDLPSFELPGYEAKDKTALNAQAALSYSPSALSRIALRYQTMTGHNRSRSLAASITFHF